MTAGVCGIVLAAGAGTRYGSPKALAADASSLPWIVRVVATLRRAGCDPVLVCLGARRDEAAELLPTGVRIVDVPDWADGLSASVRAGLVAAADTDAVAGLIVPVDVPELPASACVRVCDLASIGPDALRRATYHGAPGHPALIGRAHWAAVGEELSGDRGAGPYLRAHRAAEVECGDLWDGHDIDVRT